MNVNQISGPVISLLVVYEVVSRPVPLSSKKPKTLFYTRLNNEVLNITEF